MDGVIIPLYDCAGNKTDSTITYSGMTTSGKETAVNTPIKK
jgi:hypothetical protein